MAKRSAKSLESERRFRELVEQLGGTCTYEEWSNSRVGHAVVCSEGHECSPAPGNLLKGQGVCRVCSGNDPKEAERKFRDEVDRQGGRCVYNKWLGTRQKHAVICREGHECRPIPGPVSQGTGICRECAGLDPAAAEKSFRERVADQGGTCVYDQWLGVMKPHAVICKFGHECSPRPNDVKSGSGLCRICKGKVWDAFYVVVNPVQGLLKFGITSGDPKSRLDNHRSDGFTTVLRCWSGVADDGAHRCERELIRLLKAAGVKPVRGREYFPEAVSNVVLAVADAWFSNT